MFELEHDYFQNQAPVFLTQNHTGLGDQVTGGSPASPGCYLGVKVLLFGGVSVHKIRLLEPGVQGGFSVHSSPYHGGTPFLPGGTWALHI